MVEIIFDDFLKVDICIGVVVDVQFYFEVCKFVIKFWVDFGGDLGVKKFLVQIIKYYIFESVVGKCVMVVVNFLLCQIGKFMFEILVFGVLDDEGEVVLIMLDKEVFKGGRFF